MISIKNQIPGIYYEASRDFQVLGHLYEATLNYSKTNADILYLLPTGTDVDTRTTELLAMTLGFKLKRNYDKAQLAALVSIFPRLLKIKGTLGAITLAGNALVKAAGIPGEFSSKLEKHVLTITIPIELSDITLFMDLLPYILPFGIRVAIVRSTVLRETITTNVNTNTVLRLTTASARTAHGQLVQHPLGLVKISNGENGLYADYSVSSFVDDDQKAIAGLLAASPVIAVDLSEQEAAITPIDNNKEDN
jgi:hypothetical protein